MSDELRGVVLIPLDEFHVPQVLRDVIELVITSILKHLPIPASPGLLEA
jgi:hypothetical protein